MNLTKSFDLFRNRSLLILGLSESVSNIGNWITMLAVFAMVVFQDSRVCPTWNSTKFKTPARPAPGRFGNPREMRHVIIPSELRKLFRDVESLLDLPEETEHD